MNEQNSEAGVVETTSSPVPYKDRSVGLVIFGILTILLGCVAGLFVPLMLFGQMASNRATGTPVAVSTLLPAMSVYLFLAVALIWLGIGSIMARRWSRALLLIFSWSWLVTGTLILVGTLFFIPVFLAGLHSKEMDNHQAVPPEVLGIAFVVMLLMLGIIFVILPAIWTFFYSSRNVKATCEMRDPVTRWTDKCPLPVLGLCSWLLFSVPMMLLMPISDHGVMPFFGVFLTGWPGSLLCLFVAALWSYAAWLLYKLESRGWWLILIALCVFMVSAALTYARHDMAEMYHLMGYPKAQIEQMQTSGLMKRNLLGWMTVCSVLPFLGYLIFIKKYFRSKS
jgi:hypothetical protein